MTVPRRFCRQSHAETGTPCCMDDDHDGDHRGFHEGAVICWAKVSPLRTPGSDRTTVEAVDHPPHYNAGDIEVIDAIEDWKLGFHEGNVVKYVARAEHKGNQLQDLKKARWYLERRIEQLSK